MITWYGYTIQVYSTTRKIKLGNMKKMNVARNNHSERGNPDQNHKNKYYIFLISPLGVNFETSIVSIEMCVTFGMLVKSGS